MALAFLLARFAKKHKIALHVLTVDHGLRAESKKEAKRVMGWVAGWPNVTHKILNWTGAKPKTRIQEEARKARYALIEAYCRKEGINYLFLAHHGDDQVETFLFRLAKGSGIDGLSVMPPLQKLKDVTLVRPLLVNSHADLLAVCRKNRLGWIEDPSNHADRFARVRLRQSKEILEREGLTVDRVLSLVKRLERARNTLDQVTDKQEKKCIVEKTAQRIEIDLERLKAEPEEIGLRILQRSLVHVARARKYPPGLQTLEGIFEKIGAGQFKAATLAGCLIRKKKDRIEIVREG